MRRFLLIPLLGGLAFAQSSTQPITPQDYVQQENQANGTALTYEGSQLITPNLLELFQLCNAPEAVIYDKNRTGKVDTLKVYGVNRIDPQIWKLRGPTALGSAAQKAELRAKGYAVEFLKGVQVITQSTNKSTDRIQTGASSASNGQDSAMVSTALSEVSETLETFDVSRAEGFLRFGKVTGTRTVSLGDLGMCVVVRYELPLDQSRGPDGTPVRSNTNPPGSGPTNNNPGYPSLPPGSTGDF